jgi:hypothetical protein
MDIIFFIQNLSKRSESGRCFATLCIKVLKVVNSHEEEMAGCCSDEDMDDLDKKDDDDEEEEVKFYLFFLNLTFLIFLLPNLQASTWEAGNL